MLKQPSGRLGKKVLAFPWLGPDSTGIVTEELTHFPWLLPSRLLRHSWYLAHPGVDRTRGLQSVERFGRWGARNSLPYLRDGGDSGGFGPRMVSSAR